MSRLFLRWLGYQIDGGGTGFSKSSAPTVVDPPYGVAGGGGEVASGRSTPAPLDPTAATCERLLTLHGFES